MNKYYKMPGFVKYYIIFVNDLFLLLCPYISTVCCYIFCEFVDCYSGLEMLE